MLPKTAKKILLHLIKNNFDFNGTDEIAKKLESMNKYGFKVEYHGEDVVLETDVHRFDYYDQGNLMDYIYISKSKAKDKNKLNLIPEALKSKVTYDDVDFNVSSF
jgi:hypothetical protein